MTTSDRIPSNFAHANGRWNQCQLRRWIGRQGIGKQFFYTFTHERLESREVIPTRGSHTYRVVNLINLGHQSFIMELHGTFHWHIVHLPMVKTRLRSASTKTVVLRQTANADLSQHTQLNAGFQLPFSISTRRPASIQPLNASIGLSVLRIACICQVL